MFSIHHVLAGIGVLLLLQAPGAKAQIYKWVDAKGQTHYSEKKDEAGAAKTAEIKVQLPPQNESRMPDWKQQEQEFQKRQAQKKPENTTRTDRTSPKQDAANWRGETPKDKCSLARAVIDGSAKRSNGAATTAHDLEVAKNDTQLFCR